MIQLLAIEKTTKTNKHKWAIRNHIRWAVSSKNVLVHMLTQFQSSETKLMSLNGDPVHPWPTHHLCSHPRKLNSSTLKNWWLEDEFPVEIAYFQGRTSINFPDVISDVIRSRTFSLWGPNPSGNHGGMGLLLHDPHATAAYSRAAELPNELGWIWYGHDWTNVRMHVWYILTKWLRNFRQ